MNQIAEDFTEDDAIGDRVERVEKVAAELRAKSQFTRPTYSFKGADLFPFTYGYELLFNQVRDPEDTGLFTWLAFVYLLRKHDPDEDEHTHRKWAIGNAWKVENFRLNLSVWMDAHGPFTNEDKIEAKRIYEESMKAAAETSVEAVPDRKRSVQKKTHRQKKPSSSTSSEGS